MSLACLPLTRHLITSLSIWPMWRRSFVWLDSQTHESWDQKQRSELKCFLFGNLFLCWQLSQQLCLRGCMQSNVTPSNILRGCKTQSAAGVSQPWKRLIDPNKTGLHSRRFQKTDHLHPPSFRGPSENADFRGFNVWCQAGIGSPFKMLHEQTGTENMKPRLAEKPQILIVVKLASFKMSRAACR